MHLKAIDEVSVAPGESTTLLARFKPPHLPAEYGIALEGIDAMKKPTGPAAVVAQRFADFWGQPGRSGDPSSKRG